MQLVLLLELKSEGDERSSAMGTHERRSDATTISAPRSSAVGRHERRVGCGACWVAVQIREAVQRQGVKKEAVPSEYVKPCNDKS